MKTHIKNRFFILVIALFPLWGSGGLGISSCSKNDDNNPQNPVDQLPPATQTGENTIGCLVNGEALLPKGISPSGNRQCFYQLVDGEYYFGMSFKNKINKNKVNISKLLNVTLQKTEIQEGEIYILNNSYTNSPEFPWGGGIYTFSPSVLEGITYYFTSQQKSGELKITNFDQENSIISGTFWFDAENEDGEIVKIRDGRFDMHYTQ